MKLRATGQHGYWLVYSGSIRNGIPAMCGEGRSLPAAYLDYLRKFRDAKARNKAAKAEEQRCIDCIKKILAQDENLELPPPLNREVNLGSSPTELAKRKWYHWASRPTK